MKQELFNAKVLKKNNTLKIVLIVLSILLIISQISVFAEEVFSPEDVLKIKSCNDPQISNDGEWIAYTLSVPRCKCDKPGGSYSELYLVSTKTNEVKPFITGKVSIESPRWSPDGSKIAFLTEKGEKSKTQVWTISVSGGESIEMTNSETNVKSFRWHPSGKKIVYIAIEPDTKKEKKLEEKGYEFIYYQEKFKHRNLYMVDLENKKIEQLTHDVTVWNFTGD